MGMVLPFILLIVIVRNIQAKIKVREKRIKHAQRDRRAATRRVRL